MLRDAAVRESGYQLLALDTYAGGDPHAPSLRQAQIDWFDAQMKSIGEGPVIIAVHHPLIETGVPWVDEKMRVQNGDEIQRILKAHRGKVAGVFHGHIHQVMTTVERRYCPY